MFNPYAVSTDYESWVVPFGAFEKKDFESKAVQLEPMIEAKLKEMGMESFYRDHPRMVHRVLGLIFHFYNEADYSPEQLQEVKDTEYKIFIPRLLRAVKKRMEEEDAEAAAKAAEAAAAEAQKRRDDPFLNPDYVDETEGKAQANAAHQAEKDLNQNERNAAAVIAQDALRKRNEGIRSGSGSGSGASGEPDRPYKNPTQATTNHGKTHQEIQNTKLGNMSRDAAFNILNNFTRLFYDQCENHFDEDYETLETNTNELRSLSHRKGHEDLSETARKIIEGRWNAAIAEWLQKYPQHTPGRFLHGIDKKEGMPSNKEAGLAYFIEGHFPGAWNNGDSIKMTFGRHLFEMKRYFIERLIAEKVQREFETLDNSSRDSTFRQKGLIKYRFSKEYLQDQREKLQKAGQIKEGVKGRFYDKHRTAVQLQTEVVNGKKKRKPASSRKRLAGIYAALHKAEGMDKRYAGMSKDGKSEIWWGEKAQTDWLFLA